MESGDIIQLEYDTWQLDPEELIYTTHEDVAKAADKYNENHTYGPASVIIGEGNVIPGFDEALKSVDTDDVKEIIIDPKDAYGERDPKMVEVHSIREIERLPEFRRKDADRPRIGSQVRMKNRIGMINYMTASRARIDFNHPYAGKQLRIKFKVLKKMETDDEIARAILGIHYGRKDEFKIAIEDELIKIWIADHCKLDQNWLLMKLRIVADLRKHTNASAIEFIESYEIKKEEDQAAAADTADTAETEQEREGDEGEASTKPEAGEEAETVDDAEPSSEVSEGEETTEE